MIDDNRTNFNGGGCRCGDDVDAIFAVHVDWTRPRNSAVHKIFGSRVAVRGFRNVNRVLPAQRRIFVGDARIARNNFNRGDDCVALRQAANVIVNRGRNIDLHAADSFLNKKISPSSLAGIFL